MDQRIFQGLSWIWISAVMLVSLPLKAAELPDLLDTIRPGIVAIGTVRPVKRTGAQNLPVVFRGTGFVVRDGGIVVTNLHVLPDKLDKASDEALAVFIGRGQQVKAHTAVVVGRDAEHDLAVLKLETPAQITPLKLASDTMVREGEAIFFTGFPLGMVLGLFPVTNQSIISAVTPFVIPATSSGALNAAQIKALRHPFEVYQLDAIAYPGNSGSPVMELASGRVVGVVNSVFVKDTKENVLKTPSGITYAIPVRYVNQLLRQVP